VRDFKKGARKTRPYFFSDILGGCAMRRANGKPPVKDKGKMPEPELAVDTPVNIGQIRDQITKAVGSRALHMVRTTITEVENGHYLAMKYLFEMVGLYPATAATDPSEEGSLAKILLRNLGLQEELAQPQTKVSEDSPESWSGAASDAVK
jgi:hypothetical protein